MKAKTIIGISLAALSLCGMVLWETVGRVRLTTSEVLVAARDIEEGSTVSMSDFAAARIEKGSVLAGVLAPQSAYALDGLTAKCGMAAGQQVLSSYVGEDDRLGEGESYYVLPASWIWSRSSLTAEGDECSLYLMPDKKLLGSYRAAIVGENVEIVCRPQDYFMLCDELRFSKDASLLIVINDPGWRVMSHEEDI